MIDRIRCVSFSRDAAIGSGASPVRKRGGEILNLTVIDETGTRTEQVSVPDTVAVGRIASRLVQMMGLPQSGADGQPLSYGFRHEGSGRRIGEEETLAQADVNEHDVLRLVALTTARAHAPASGHAETLQPSAPPSDQPPTLLPQRPVEHTVLSPEPPAPSRRLALAGRRWSPTMAIALIVLAVALVGVAVAIVARRGGNSGTRLRVHSVITNTASPQTSTTTSDESGEQAAGEASEDTSTTRNGAFPDVSTQEMESEIQQMLQSWHEAVVRGDYHAAWELLSQRKQAQQEGEGGYAAWQKNQSTLRPYLNPAGLQVSIKGTEPISGVAQVDVTGMTWDKPGASCSEWSGLTWVKYENGEWRYDPGYSTTPQREREWKSRYFKLLGGSC